MARTYTGEERRKALELLAACGGNVKRVSRETGIPRATLTDWKKHSPSASDGTGVTKRAGKKEIGGVTEGVTEAGEAAGDGEEIGGGDEILDGELARRLGVVARELLAAVPGKIQRASLIQVMTGLGICIDKMRLLRGETAAGWEAELAGARDELDGRIALLTERRGAAGVPGDALGPGGGAAEVPVELLGAGDAAGPCGGVADLAGAGGPGVREDAERRGVGAR